MSCDTKVETVRMNHTDDPEEEELGIYSDDDEGGDLSDDEPPITDQDTSGRPQSQFKLRVTSAITTHNHQQGAEANATAGHTDTPTSNHLDAIADEFLDEQYDQLDDLDIGNDQPIIRQGRVAQREQDSASQQSTICKDTKIK